MPPAPAKWVGPPWCAIPFPGGLAASDRGGLHAGFGNRPKDAWAYSNAGVPPAMVLIIDPASRLVQQQQLTASAASSAAASATATATATATIATTVAGIAAASAPDTATASTWVNFSHVTRSVRVHLVNTAHTPHCMSQACSGVPCTDTARAMYVPCRSPPSSTSRTTVRSAKPSTAAQAMTAKTARGEE